MALKGKSQGNRFMGKSVASCYYGPLWSSPKRCRKSQWKILFLSFRVLLNQSIDKITVEKHNPSRKGKVGRWLWRGKENPLQGVYYIYILYYIYYIYHIYIYIIYIYIYNSVIKHGWKIHHFETDDFPSSKFLHGEFSSHGTQQTGGFAKWVVSFFQRNTLW